MPMPRAALCMVTALALGLPGCVEREQAAPAPLLSASASARKASSIAPPEPPPEPRQGMVWIPAGALVAGTPPDAFPRLADEEIPGEQFILGGFYVDVYPYPNEEGATPLTSVSRDEARTLCQEANITADWVIEIVEHGIVQPSGRTPEDWLFDDRAPVTLKRAVKLHQELELEWEGVALALELLEEVQHLRRENSMLRQRLGRFTQM